MMKFILADGKIRFLSHKVEWQETRKQYDAETKQMVDVLSDVKAQEVWSVAQKDNLIAKLAKRDITPTVTAIDQPSAELLVSCEGKTFSSYDDALSFTNGTYEEPLTLESLAEVLADIIGGAL